MTETKEQKSLGELFTDLSHEIRTLIQKEMELLRMEMSGKLLQMVKDFAAVGIGGIFIYSGFLAIIAAIVFGVALFIPLWLSALLTGCLFMVIGVAMVQKGRLDIAQMKLSPDKTTESMKETAKWMKSQMK